MLTLRDRGSHVLSIVLGVERVDLDSKEPLWQQLARIIRQAIIDGELPVGRVIPSKKTLAQFHEISVRTVNTAEERLVAEGILESEVGKGMYVIRKPASARPTAP